MGFERIEIKDIDGKIVEEMEGLCLPEDKLDDPLFIEGTTLWRKWMRENLKKYDSLGKVAFKDTRVVGSIQYVPKRKQKVVEIKCIFADESDRGYEVKKRLLKDTIREFEKPKSYFGNEAAKALVAFPHPVPQDLGNADFYRTNGFKETSDNGHIFYYPLKKGYKFHLEEAKIDLGRVEKDKALIFCNSSCPYCVKEMMDALDLIRDMDDEVPIKIILPFEEPSQLATVFSMPVSMVIGDEVIGYSVLEDEKLLRKLKSALKSKSHLLNTKQSDVEYAIEGQAIH